MSQQDTEMFQNPGVLFYSFCLPGLPDPLGHSVLQARSHTLMHTHNSILTFLLGGFYTALTTTNP